MTLLEQVQQAAVDKDSDLATLLRMCKVLAARLGSVPLEEWVLHESNGYPEDVEVPAYRVWGTRIVAHFIDEIGRQMTNVTVPPHKIPEPMQARFQSYEYRRSVATAEYALTTSTDGMQTLATGNLPSLLHDAMYKGFQCHSALAQYSNQNLVAMLDAVRNRILDFTLALGKVAPNAGEREARVEPQRVTQIFNTTIHGPVGMVGSVRDSTVNVTANDWASLARFLETEGVARADVQQLEEAVAAEPTRAGGNFGPRVSKWIGKMMGKASDGSWQVTVGAAGNLLAQALSAYYGLSK